MKILGVIPARIGSKGIPRKNLVTLQERPLLSYVIEAALSTKLIAKVIVSTDSEEIAEVALKWGATVPFLRPKELALDHVSVIPVAQHALSFYQERSFQSDVVASLQPTSPLVSPKDIDRCLQLMIETDCDSCFTMKKIEEYHPSRMYGMVGDRVVQNPYTSESHLQRQDREPVYKLDGAVIARKAEQLEQWSGDDLAFGDDRRGVLVPWYRAVDVNEPIDLIVVESIMKRYKWINDEVED